MNDVFQLFSAWLIKLTIGSIVWIVLLALVSRWRRQTRKTVPAA